MECGIPNSSSYSSCVVSKNLCRVILPVQDSQKYFTTLKNIDVLYNQWIKISTDYLKILKIEKWLDIWGKMKEWVSRPARKVVAKVVQYLR